MKSSLFFLLLLVFGFSWSQNPMWCLPESYVDPIGGQVTPLPNPTDPMGNFYIQGASWPEVYDGRPAEHAMDMMPDEIGDI